MIFKHVNNRKMVAQFGNGTIRIGTKVSKNLAQVEFVSCKEQDIGTDTSLDNIRENSYKIILSFSKKESIDVLIDQLTYLREDFKKES